MYKTIDFIEYKLFPGMVWLQAV